jgi:DHA1 family multidrug resistance protein-like MFS transporter
VRDERLKDTLLAEKVERIEPHPVVVSETGECHPSSHHYVAPRELKRLMMAIVLVAACAELAYTTVNLSAMGPFIKAHKLGDVWIGVAGICFIFFEGILKSPFGLLGDRVGRRSLILAGPCVSIVTCLITPHVRDPWLLIGLRILDGVGAAALWPAAFSLIGDHVPEAHRSRAMSMFNIAYLSGLALGFGLGGGANDFAHNKLHFTLVESKSASFYVASVLFALASLTAMVVVPRGRPNQHSKSDSAESGIDLKAFVAMLQRMPMTLLMTFTTFMGIGLITLYVKVFTLGYFHISESKFGALLLGPALIIAALSVPMGSLGDKIGKAKAVKIGIGVCALSFWLILATVSIPSLIIFGTTLGLGFIVSFPAWMALVSSMCDSSQRGAAIGAVGTAQGLGAICGVGICTLIYRYGPLYIAGVTIPKHGLPFLCCGIMLTISFALSLISVKDPVRE